MLKMNAWFQSSDLFENIEEPRVLVCGIQIINLFSWLFKYKRG